MSTKELAKIISDFIFFKILGNEILIALINIFIPLYLPELIANDSKMVKILIFVLVIANIYSVVVKRIQRKKYRNAKLYCLAHQSIGEFNKEFSTDLYREHKDIIEYIGTNGIIDTNVIKKDTNFQAISFKVCSKIYNIIKAYGCEECFVTVYQRFQQKGIGKSDYVKMIAFSGKGGYQSKTYSEKYHFKTSSSNYKIFENTVFYRLFNKNSDEELILLKNKKEIQKNFYFLPQSKNREKNICQYIGIGVRTNRNVVEFVLQLDVSQKHVFGYTKKQMANFVNEILTPYVNFLYACYENEMFHKTMYDKLNWKN